MTRFGGTFLALTVLFTVVGQLLVKRGMLQVGVGPERVAALPAFVLRAFSNPSVVLGLGCAVVASACWTVAIARAELNVAYPFLGLGIVLVLALSGALFGEVVPIQRWIGVLVVCVGLFIASR